MVNKIKHKSTNQYFQERCIGEAKTSLFGKLFSPSYQTNLAQNYLKIVLNESNKIVSYDTENAEVFKWYFAYVGEDYSFDPARHPSLNNI